MPLPPHTPFPLQGPAIPYLDDGTQVYSYAGVPQALVKHALQQTNMRAEGGYAERADMLMGLSCSWIFMFDDQKNTPLVFLTLVVLTDALLVETLGKDCLETVSVPAPMKYRA